MLWEVYGYFPHHDNGTHLTGGVPDNAVWKSCWHRLDAQSASWYSGHPGKFGSRFTAVLSAEWRGVLDKKWKSEQPLVFSHVLVTKTLGTCKAREIWSKINLLLDLWERVIHAGLVGDALAGGRARKVRVAIIDEEEGGFLAHNFHITLLSGNLWQEVFRATNRA